MPPKEEPEIEEGGANPQTMSTQLKCQRSRKQVWPQKKSKASKTSFNPITLTEEDLHDIGETVCNVTTEALQQLMEENQMALGALRAQIQELQVCTPHASTPLTSLTVGMAETKEMLRAYVTNPIVLSKGALVTENEADRPMVRCTKRSGDQHGFAPLGDALSSTGWSNCRTVS